MELSQRSRIDTTPSPLGAVLSEARQLYPQAVDLTLSNPTRAELSYAAYTGGGVFELPAAGVYDPDPLGDRAARRAVARHWPACAGLPTADEIVLLPSSSEAYHYLFLLLCDAGDDVLAPEPSYPLLAHLARYAGIQLRPYRLAYDGAWHIDLASLSRARTERTRAIVLISPNNPTGSYTSRVELAELASLGLPLISDEVFSQYPTRARPELLLSAFGASPALTFCIDGLSKSAGLPHLKLSWIGVSGPAPAVRESMQRLTWMADTYLATATPVQRALPEILNRAPAFRAGLSARLHQNRDILARALAGSAASLLDSEGGWYAVVRLPDLADEDEWVLGLLNAGAATHPGYFYDFEDRAPHLVLSLLAPPAAFKHGAGVLRSEVDRRVASR
ncbi:MAG TPA: pyridoxal phosphate-dependent aminotransferase [Polyangiaceae bacterium]|nr:pyridoxal phosphate-dependent aminotransferase [Polyangiaceae bacterium]